MAQQLVQAKKLNDEPDESAASSDDERSESSLVPPQSRHRSPWRRHLSDLLFQTTKSASAADDEISPFRIIDLPPDLEKTYQGAHQQRLLPVFRFALLAATFFVLAYILWDWFIYAPAMTETLPVRITAAFAQVGLWSLTFHPAMQKRVAVLMYAAVIVGVMSISIILLLLQNGFVYGLASLIFYMLASIAIAPSFRVVLWGTIILAVIPNIVMTIGLSFGATSPFLIINANAFIIPLCILTCLLSFLTDQNYRRTFQLEHTLKRLAATDTLTGVHNRRSLLSLAETEIQRARRHNRSLCMLLLDIDRFKPVNDTYGHYAGDEVIKIVAATGKSILRETDIFGRVGGEEFGAILPETEAGGAMELAERVRRALESTEVPIDHTMLKVTVSIGVTCLQDQDTGISSLLRRADDAMYEAKQTGRNRVVLAS